MHMLTTIQDNLVANSFVLLPLSLAVSALSITITKAKVFRWFRKLIQQQSNWLGELISCPYCMSHWFALAMVAVYRPTVVSSRSWLLDLGVSVMAIVALAAMLSGLIAKALLTIKSLPEPEQPSDVETQLRAALEVARSKLVEQHELLLQRDGQK